MKNKTPLWSKTNSDESRASGNELGMAPTDQHPAPRSTSHELRATHPPTVSQNPVKKSSGKMCNMFGERRITREAL
jgi:hypothetical protein